MPISPHLLRKLQETLGVDAADDLVNRLESMDAYRGDIEELRHEMQLGFARGDARLDKLDGRFDKLDGRFDKLDARFDVGDARIGSMATMFDEKLDKFRAQMEALLEKGLREQTRFFFLAWSVLLAAMVGLYAR